MTSKWLINQRSTDRVKALLEQAGLPLELSVERICKEFSTASSSKHNLYIDSAKVVYSGVQNTQDYREIDRLVNIYDEFAVCKLTGIQLNLSIPIECKSRRDVEVFAFPLGDKNPHTRFPLHSEMAGSQYFKSLINAFALLANIPYCDLTLLKIENGETPQKIHEENLVYNAAGSLYDFVLTEASMDGESKASFARQLINNTGLVTSFRKYIDRTHYGWQSVMHDWIASVSQRRCESFNKKYFEGKCIYHYIGAHLPVLCLDSPIYLASWSNGLGIERFEEISYCISSIRKHGWPGMASLALLSTKPELPIIVTNKAHLAEVLELALLWYQGLRARLEAAKSETIGRWALAAGLSSAIIRSFKKHDVPIAYRSVLDFGL